MKYKLKHECIEAFQYLGKIVDDNGVFCIPDWAVKEYKIGRIYEYENNVCIDVDGSLWYVNIKDYIIRGSNGKLYTCSKRTFEALFGEVV